MVVLSRRRFLGAAGALAAAAVTGCGHDDVTRAPASDAEVLATLPEPDPGADVARRQRALFAYVAALPQLTAPEDRARVLRLAVGEAGEIATARLRAGAEPVPDAFAGFTEPAR